MLVIINWTSKLAESSFLHIAEHLNMQKAIFRQPDSYVKTIKLKNIKRVRI